MGQRHQVFIKIQNPAYKLKEILELSNKEKWEGKVNEWVDYKQQLKKYSKELGNKPTTVLAYHHQWLYGRSPIATAEQVLSFFKGLQGEYEEHNNPFHKKYFYHNNVGIEDRLQVIHNLLRINFNKHGFRGEGTSYERFYYLNEEDLEMRSDCMIGDNNDGITIIDLTKMKYCFMFIDSYHLPEKENKPITAREYMQAYYKESTEQMSKDDIKYKKETQKMTIDKIKEECKEAKELNIELAETMKGFGLLNENDLKEIFPKVFGKPKEKPISFNKFKETSNAEKYGTGKYSKYIIYFGHNENRWQYKIYPNMDGYSPNKQKALKEAYEIYLLHLQGETNRDIKEGEFKVSISYA